eukprot:1072027-Pleurochrysis_carterae.AAC.1
MGAEPDAQGQHASLHIYAHCGGAQAEHDSDVAESWRCAASCLHHGILYVEALMWWATVSRRRCIRECLSWPAYGTPSIEAFTRVLPAR